MTNERTNELIEAVNAALDPVALVNLINYYPEKKVLSGTTLRVPCPVHREPEYLTLFVNTRKKTYRCSVESCAAHEMGDLVGLYALANEVSRPAAAREIARRLRLPIDLESFARIAEDCFDEAEEHYVKRELAHAEEMARQTLAIDDRHVEALQLLARIYLEQRRPDDAATCFLDVARILADRGGVDDAERILRRAIGHHCQPDRMYEALAQLLLEHGRRDDARHVLEEQLLIARTSSDAETEIALLEEISDLAPDDETVREELARTLERAGNDERAIDLFLRLGERELDKGRHARALAYLEEALRLNPSFVLALERQADVHLARQDTYAAAEVLKQLSTLARDRGDADGARDYLNRIVDLLPNDARTFDYLAEFHEWAAEPARAIDARLRAARLLRASGQLPEARERLEALVARAPEHVEAVEELGELLLQHGLAEEGVDRFDAAAQLYLKKGRRDEALRLLRQVVLLDEGRLEQRRAILAKMVDFGFDRAADEERRELVRRAFLSRSYDICLALVEEGLARSPHHLELLGYRREVLLKLDRPDEAALATCQLADELVAGGRTERAEQVLRESLGVARDPALFDRLLMLLLQAGRGQDASDLLLDAATWLGEESHRPRGIEFARVVLQSMPGATAIRMLLAGWLLESRQVSEAILLFRDLAEQARLSGEFSRAEQCLRLILKAAPEDVQARADLARLAAERGEAATARTELRRLVDAESHWDDATIEALRRSLLRTASDDASLLQGFIRRLEGHEGTAARAALGDAALAMARLQRDAAPKEAAEWSRKAVAARPGDVAAMLFHQKLLHRAGIDADEQRRLTDEALENARRVGNEAVVAEVLSQALDLFPADEAIVADAIDTLSAEDHHDQLVAACTRLAARAREQSDRAGEKRWIDQKITLSGGAASPGDLERLAILARETSNRQEQLDALLRLIQARREREGTAAALDQAMAVIKAFPLDARPRELVVELLREVGDVDRLVEEIVTLGDLAVSRRSWSRAEMHFREALELRPDRLDIVERHAQSYEERGERDKAALHYADLARRHAAAGHRGEAMRCARHCSDLDPTTIAHLPLLLDLQEQAEDFEEAAATALRLAEDAVTRRDAADLSALSMRATSLDPKNAGLRSKLAELHAALGLRDKASRLHAAAGQIYYDEQHFPEAEAACREALALNDDLVSAHELLLKLQQRSGDTEGTVESLRSLAISHSSEGSIEDSVAVYRRLLEVAPDDRQALVDLSECLLLLGRESEAAKALRQLCFALDVKADADMLMMHGRRLIELDPRDTELRERLAEAYAAQGKVMPEVDQRAAIFMDTVGRTATRPLAESQLQRLREIAPTSFETRLCNARWEQGDKKAAAALYERMIGELREENDARSLVRLATILAETEPTRHALRVQAVAALLQGAGLTDETVSLMRALQRDLAAASAVDLQVSLLDATIEASSGNPKYLLERADLLLGNERRDAALADYTAAALHHLKHDKGGEALRILQKCARLAPDNAEVQRLLAEAAEKVNDPTTACAALSRHLDLLEREKAPEEALLAPLLRLAELMPTEDSYQERLLKLYRDLGRNKQAAEVLVERAQRLERAGRTKEAERDYVAALKTDPSHSPGRKAFAEHLARLGRTAEARTEYLALAEQFDGRGKVGLAIQAVNLARELDPNDPVAYQRLGEIYQRQNNKERALNAYFAASNRYLDRKQAVPAAELLVRSMEFAPEDGRAAKQLFTIFFALPEGEETTSLGMRLARGFLRGGEVKQAAAILERLRNAPGHTWEFQVAIAELFAEFDQRAQAHDIYLETATQLVVEGRTDDALVLVGMAEKLDYNLVDIERTRAEILEHRGAPPELLVDVWRRLADLLREAEEGNASPDQELALRERILGVAPADAANRERIAEIHMASGDTTLAAEQFVALADRALPGDVAEGIRRLRQAIGADGSHAGAVERLAALHAGRGEVELACEEWARLARLHRDAGRLGEEEAVLVRVLRENPNHIEALRAMMEIVRRRQDATAFWNYGLKLAMIFESMDRTDEARRLYEEAVMMDGTNIEAWERLAANQERAGDKQATVRIQKNIARAYEEHGNVERALEAYEKALEAAPEELNLAIEAADLAAANGLNQVAANLLEASLAEAGRRVDVEPDLLRELCTKLLQLAPARHETRRMLAHLLEDAGDTELAASEWDKLATFYATEGRVSDALLCLKRLRALLPLDADRITLRIASLESAGGREEEAARLYLSLIDKARAANRKEEALDLARRMSKDLPFDPTGEELAAELSGELGQGAARIRHLCSLASRLADTGDLMAAEGRIAEARIADPESLDPIRAHGRLLLQAGALAEAQDVFDDLLRRADAAGDEFMVVEALRGLKTAAPEDLKARVRLLELYEREGNIEELARERSEMVEIFFMLGDVDSASDIATLLLNDPVTTPDVIFRIGKRFEGLAASDVALHLYLEMARQHLEKEEFGVVEEALDAARDIRSDDLELLDLTIALQEKIGDFDAAHQTRERLAMASVDAGQLNDAELHLQKVIAARPDDAEARMQLARVYGLRQNPRRQAEELRIAADLFDREGYVERAYATLQQLIVLQPDDEAALRKIVEIAPSFLAVEEFRPDFLRLAEVYITRGRHDEFELLAQEADAIMPGDPTFAEYRAIVARGERLTERRAASVAPAPAPAPATPSAASAPSAATPASGDLAPGAAFPPGSSPPPAPDDAATGLDAFFDALDGSPAPAGASPAFDRPPTPDLDSIWGAGEFSSVPMDGPEGAMEAPALTPEEVDEELDFEIDPGLIRSQIRAGEGAKVADLLHLALRQRPSDLDLHLLLAEAHLAIGERAMAVQELATAASLMDNPRDLRRLSVARAIHEIEPDSVRALANYVDLLFEFEKTDEALARALVLAETYRRRGMLDNAEELVRRILAHDAQHLGALQLLVTLHRDVTPPHDFALDLVLYATALGIEGHVDEAHAALDQARTLGSYAVEPMTAVVRARRSLGRDQRLADELTILARLYVDEGNPVLALGCLEEADTISTSGSLEREEVRRRIQQVTPRAGMRLGGGLRAAPDPHDTQSHRSEAIENFLAVLQVDPKNADVHEQIANLYAQAADGEGERLHRLEAIRILEQRGDWPELIERLPGLVMRFPDVEAFGEALKKARMQVRVLQLLEGNETQTFGSDAGLAFAPPGGAPAGAGGPAAQEASGGAGGAPAGGERLASPQPPP